MKLQKLIKKNTDNIKSLVEYTDTITTRKSKRAVPKNTQVRFLLEVQSPTVSKMNRPQLATHMFPDLEVKKSTSKLDQLLRGCGFTFRDLAWGGTMATRNKEFLVSLYKKGDHPKEIITQALGLNVKKPWKSIEGVINKAIGTHDPVLNDIDSGTPLMPCHHDREPGDAALGGVCLRDGTPGMIVPSYVNSSISYLGSALQFRECQIRFLYCEWLYSKRARWIIVKHYELYGRRSFKSILKRFFPALSRKEYKRLAVSVA